VLVTWKASVMVQVLRLMRMSHTCRRRAAAAAARSLSGMRRGEGEGGAGCPGGHRMPVLPVLVALVLQPLWA
jgi:hypothetical protein